MTDFFGKKTLPKLYCEYCDYTCRCMSEWTRHTTTRKHVNSVSDSQKNQQNEYKCGECDKTYKHRQSLFTHKKRCQVQVNSIVLENAKTTDIMIESKPNMEQISNEMVMKLIDQNNELQKQIIEMSKQSAIVNNNITNNNQFNLNMFLNETCKDALNIDDFMNSLELTVEDLEQTGKLGFVQGITRIFLKGLRDLDVTQRPFHCTDTKRETVYVKDQDKWEKESDKKTKMKQALNQAVRKNLKLISLWREEHPDYLKSNTQDNDDYIKISLNSLGSEYEDEQQRMDEKIIRNVLREVILDKKIAIKDN